MCMWERVILQCVMRRRGWILNIMKILMGNSRRMPVTQIKITFLLNLLWGTKRGANLIYNRDRGRMTRDAGAALEDIAGCLSMKLMFCEPMFVCEVWAVLNLWIMRSQNNFSETTQRFRGVTDNKCRRIHLTNMTKLSSKSIYYSCSHCKLLWFAN